MHSSVGRSYDLYEEVKMFRGKVGLVTVRELESGVVKMDLVAWHCPTRLNYFFKRLPRRNVTF